MPSSARLLKLTTGWCWTCVSKILIRLWSLVAPSVAPQLETLISFMFRAAVLLMVPPPWNTNGHTYRISTNTFLNALAFATKPHFDYLWTSAVHFKKNLHKALLKVQGDFF